MELSSLPVWAQQLGALILTVSTAFAIQWQAKREKKDAPAIDAAGEVVAATFTERSLMQNLTAALTALNTTIVASNEVSGELVGLLRAEAQRRHDEAIVRQALRDRGIVE